MAVNGGTGGDTSGSSGSEKRSGSPLAKGAGSGSANTFSHIHAKCAELETLLEDPNSSQLAGLMKVLLNE